jgi:hypothetical protein
MVIKSGEDIATVLKLQAKLKVIVCKPVVKAWLPSWGELKRSLK